MRQKELRIALVCYGGVSLAVYMHGVTRELWQLARASRDFHSTSSSPDGVGRVYRNLLERIAAEQDLHVRVLPDIMSGASAGGINTVFLAQAVHSGQSLEPLTDLWLEVADVDELVDPKARLKWRFSKMWAQPFATWLLNRPGGDLADAVAPETRAEVERKVSHLVRGRWFEPPFSGIGFSRLLERAFSAMAESKIEKPLLPPGHPLDLYVTTTDFHGYLELLRLHSPPVVEDTEHRMPISFRSRTPLKGGSDLANPLADPNEDQLSGLDLRSRDIADTLRKRRRLFHQARRQLEDPVQSGFLFVLTPERLPILETERAVSALSEAGIPVVATLVNRVIPGDADGDFLRRRRDQEAQYLRQIEQAFAALPRPQLPWLETDVQDIPALEQVAALLARQGF